MRISKPILAVFLLASVFIGCKKLNLEVKEGTYTGTFTVTYQSGTKTGSTSLELKNGRYTCSGNADRIPAGGSGTYSVDKGIITFHDENIWTADFDWNLILNGPYDYTFDGKKLILSADKNNVGHYEYALEKK